MSAESKIQTRAVAYARSLGLLVKRNYQGPGAESGWPDVELFAPGGRVVLIEFKSPGKEPSKLQQYRIQRLVDLGHRVHVCDNLDDARTIIEGCFYVH